jgi:hypothetical protein
MAPLDEASPRGREARAVYFECPKCSHRSASARYVIEAVRKVFICANCGARVERTERLGRIFLVMLLYGGVLFLIEYLLNPSARFPWLFDASPWITVLWLGFLFVLLLAVTWRWFVRWCFGWRLQNGDRTGSAITGDHPT